MKSKIFLALAIIAVLVCAFATMAGAQDGEKYYFASYNEILSLLV